MRRIFNEARFEERTRSGELTLRIIKERVIDPIITEVGENVPEKSISQDARYIDKNNNELCRAHRYITPEGAIGGSGKTDPKTIFVNAVHYHQQREGQPTEPLTEKEFRSILAEIEMIIGTHHIGAFNDFAFSVSLNNRGEVDLKLATDGKQGCTIFYKHLDKCGFIRFLLSQNPPCTHQDMVIVFRENKVDLYAKAMQDVSGND
jgi:hypothetical protein